MAIIETTLVVKYDANGGTGTPASQTHKAIGNAYPIYNTITLRSEKPTRPGYNFVGWAKSASAGAAQYSAGGAYTYAFNGHTTNTTTLYAVWSKQAPQNSTIESLSPSAPIDGLSSRTLQIKRKNNSYLHRVEFTYGSKTEVYQSVGQGQSGDVVTLTFAIPTTWLSELPNVTSAVATCTVKTFSGSTLIGSPVSKTFTITVPDSVKPTAALSGVNQSSNSAVSGWGILVKGYSKIKLTATAQAGTGASIASIAFSGDGVNQTGTGTTVTSNTLTAAGSRQWKVTVTDTRGRTATATLTRTVHDYAKPSGSLTAFRSDNTGAASDAEGTYITAKATFSCASCNGNNTATAKISYKQHTASSWSTGQNAAANNTPYTFGGGNISVLYPYDVKVEITDAVGNKTTISGTVPNVKGVSFGLNGECARFGGPVQYDDRFECDWDTVIHGDLTVDGSINGIGETKSTTPDSSSLANNSWVGKASLTFSPGVYVLEGGCRFAANANGYRAVVLASSNNSSTILTRGARTVTPAIDGVAVVATFTMIREFTEQTTLYVNVYQNSGSALTVYPWFRAVRIR